MFGQSYIFAEIWAQLWEFFKIDLACFLRQNLQTVLQRVFVGKPFKIEVRVLRQCVEMALVYIFTKCNFSEDLGWFLKISPNLNVKVFAAKFTCSVF